VDTEAEVSDTEHLKFLRFMCSVYMQTVLFYDFSLYFQMLRHSSCEYWNEINAQLLTPDLHQVPWVVLPTSLDLGHIKSDNNDKGATLQTRWNQVNALLAIEADEWGFYGSTRSPMGKYLKHLSELAFPDSGNSSGAGSRAGIIDVIITLGKMGGNHAKKGLREPRRKLHEDHCGNNRRLIVAPEIPRRKRGHRLVSTNEELISPTPLTPIVSQVASISLKPTQKPKGDGSPPHPCTPVPIPKNKYKGSESVVDTPSSYMTRSKTRSMPKQGVYVSSIEQLSPLAQSQAPPLTSRAKTTSSTTASLPLRLDPVLVVNTKKSKSSLPKNPKLLKYPPTNENLKPYQREKPISGSVSVRELSALIESQSASMGVQQAMGLESRDGRSSRQSSVKPAGVSALTKKSSNSTIPLAPSRNGHTFKLTTRGFAQTSEGAKAPLPKTGMAKPGKPTLNTLAPAVIRPSTPSTRRPSLSLLIPRGLSESASSSSRSASTPLSSGTSKGNLAERLGKVESRSKRQKISPSSTETTPALSQLTIPDFDASIPYKRWAPNSICEDSILTYAKTADWPDTKRDAIIGRPTRRTNQEREGVFRATGILVGVRYLVG